MGKRPLELLLLSTLTLCAFLLAAVDAAASSSPQRGGRGKKTGPETEWYDVAGDKLDGPPKVEDPLEPPNATP